MTFYNIIFGILFVGSVSALFTAILENDINKICMALVLSFAIFNDTILTSHHLEHDENTYTIRMKLLDLMSFCVLGGGIVQIAPLNNIFYQDQKYYKYEIIHAPTIFWFLMIIYWLIGLIWNISATKSAKNKQNRTPHISKLIVLLPTVSLIASVTPWHSLNIICAVLSVVGYGSYLAIYKYGSTIFD